MEAVEKPVDIFVDKLVEKTRCNGWSQTTSLVRTRLGLDGLTFNLQLWPRMEIVEIARGAAVARGRALSLLVPSDGGPCRGISVVASGR
jgi:hypothetical protein